MNYDSSIEKINRHIELSFNKKFAVQTDIKNFYPSIYTHSIPWALVGFDYAKNHRAGEEWFNHIDYSQRINKRNETNGVPIGPATSNIIAEVILARIDETLTNEGFSFVRFIDDYTGFFDRFEEAELFIRRLEEELAKYKLVLSIEKTHIQELPIASSPSWIIDLTTRLPQKENLNQINVIRFLDHAVNTQTSSPDGSVLKYASKSIINEVEGENAKIMLEYLLGLSVKFPILLPLLDKLFDKLDFSFFFPYRDQLCSIIIEHSKHRRSDAISWALYYLNKFQQNIPEICATSVLQTKDCISILLLYQSGQYEDEIIEFVNNLNHTDLYLLDQYWILLYQLFYDDKIENPYSNSDAYFSFTLRGETTDEARNREIQTFQILKDNEISFLNNPITEGDVDEDE